jgi:broad specificity phosphatase PhoE
MQMTSMNEFPVSETTAASRVDNPTVAAPGTARSPDDRPAETDQIKSTPGLQFLLVRTGCTDYDQQRRIRGRLNMPLSDEGSQQVALTAADTADVDICSVYSAPCQASRQTAETIAAQTGAKVRPSVELQNLDLGLWEGKLVEDVKSQQPKVYRRWQEQPETICPPEGEMLSDARRRLSGMVGKALKKHKSGTITFVLPEPLATVFSCQLQGKELGDLWQAEKNSGKWELIDYPENGRE